MNKYVHVDENFVIIGFIKTTGNFDNILSETFFKTENVTENDHGKIYNKDNDSVEE